MSKRTGIRHALALFVTLAGVEVTAQDNGQTEDTHTVPLVANDLTVTLSGVVSSFDAKLSLVAVGETQIYVGEIQELETSFSVGEEVFVVGTQLETSGVVWASGVERTGRQSITGTGVSAQSITGTGARQAQSITGTGVRAQSITGTGASAQSITGTGISTQSITGTGARQAQSITGTGVRAQSITGTGVSAQSITGTGISAQSITGTGALQLQSITGTGFSAQSITGTGARK
jgi:hypothetical protein